MAIDEFKALFQCPISQETMADPHFLECGHVFDKKSIITYFDNTSYKNWSGFAVIKCPVCKKEVKNPSKLYWLDGYYQKLI